MDAGETVTELFSKTPEVRIILETAHDKSDEGVRNLFAIGVSHFISKPLRFENLKEVVNTVKTEFELDGNVGMGTDFEKIKDHLVIAHRTSVTKITQTYDFPSDQVLSYLLGLVSKGDVLEINPIKEVLCNKCNSVNLSQIFSCPKCACSNFEQTKLIEWYDCGAIELESAYADDKCPQCKKDLKALGVDCRVMPNLFACNDCGEKFPEPTMELNCMKCGNRFSFTEANWVQSPTFMWMKESAETSPDDVSNEEILKAISESSWWLNFNDFHYFLKICEA